MVDIAPRDSGVSATRTIIQLLSEFSIPFALAALWTAYLAYTTPSQRNAAMLVPTFGGAFFLFSWATGQIVRVRRQAKVETKLDKMVDRLDEASERLVNTVTGGPSFAYLSFSNPGGQIRVFAIAVGEFPLFDVAARIVDLDAFQRDMAAGNPFASDRNLSVGEMASKTAAQTLHTPIVLVGNSHDFNIFFSARNGLWTQQTKMRKVGGSWLQAYLVERPDRTFGSVPEGFPAIGDLKFDSFPRGNQPRLVQKMADGSTEVILVD